MPGANGCRWPTIHARANPIRRQVLSADRHRDREGSAFTHAAFHLDVSAVKFYQLLDEREADTRSFVRSSSGIFGAMKALKNAGQFGIRYADPSVGHRKVRVVAV
jgi:hypothetical protein